MKHLQNARRSSSARVSPWCSAESAWRSSCSTRQSIRRSDTRGIGTAEPALLPGGCQTRCKYRKRVRERRLRACPCQCAGVAGDCAQSSGLPFFESLLDRRAESPPRAEPAPMHTEEPPQRIASQLPSASPPPPAPTPPAVSREASPPTPTSRVTARTSAPTPRRAKVPTSVTTAAPVRKTVPAPAPSSADRQGPTAATVSTPPAKVSAFGATRTPTVAPAPPATAPAPSPIAATPGAAVRSAVGRWKTRHQPHRSHTATNHHPGTAAHSQRARGLPGRRRAQGVEASWSSASPSRRMGR